MTVRRGVANSFIVVLRILIVSSFCVSCAASSMQTTDPATWHAIHEALDRQRHAHPEGPWAAGVSMTMREPHSGRTLDGRGAIAVAPGRALRMILVGAAGTTMLDAWVTPDGWRIAIPPAGLLRRRDGARHRGRDQVDEPDDLPVGFLRWLFFRPLAGTLVGGSLEPGRVLFFLRDDEAVLEVRLGACSRGELTITTRRARGRTERLDECRASSAVTLGDWVRYEDEKSGLIVELTIESVSPGSPEEGAFRDPDADGS
jgi:hypothetical protein